MAAPLLASAQGRPPEGERLMLPESTLKLLLRNREPLGLTGDQVMTIQLKAAELEQRTRDRLGDFQRGGGRGGGPRFGMQANAGGMGVGIGAGGEGGGGPPGGGMGGDMGGPGGMGGGMGGGRGGGPRGEGGPPPGAGASSGSEERTRQLMADLEKLDRASVEAIRPVLTPAQSTKVDAMLVARAQWMAEHQPPPRPKPPEGEPKEPPAEK